MRTQELNRLELAAPIVRSSIGATVKHLDRQVTQVKAQIATHLDQHPTLRAPRARQMAAYTGLVPHVRHSGTSVRGRGALSKLGASRLRKSLYDPALAALRHNPPLIRLGARLRAAGKPNLVIIAAVMRKLVHQIFGVLRSGRPFDPARA